MSENGYLTPEQDEETVERIASSYFVWDGVNEGGRQVLRDDARQLLNKVAPIFAAHYQAKIAKLEVEIGRLKTALASKDVDAEEKGEGLSGS